MVENFNNENIIRLINRNDLYISGVNKVISFSPNQIVLIAQDQEIEVLGAQMQTTKLDDKNGELFVQGLIKNIKWSEKKEKIPLIKRIFK